MRKNLLLAATVIFMAAAACSSEKKEQVFVITDFGAVAGLEVNCTEAINACISACNEAGGGVVSVPAGEYLTSTVHLRSNVNLRLEEGSALVAVLDPEVYDSYIPEHDMSRYDSGEGTLNSNNSRDVRWNRAIVLGVCLENVSITGSGAIVGRHVFDPLGEELMRGPHAVILAECKGVLMENIEILQAPNYAIMGYALEDARFRGLHIAEGWDGVHIRGGINVEIAECRFETGDDSIAGGYWENMHVSDCYINSSCNGIRMIMPCDGFVVENCVFEGPGHYPHRTSGEARRCNMLFGVILEPGGWGAAPGDVRGVVIRDCMMTAVQSPVSTHLAADNHGYDLTLENITATGCTATVSPVVSWRDSGFDTITLNNFVVGR